MEKDRYFRIKENVISYDLCKDHKVGGVYRASDEQDSSFGGIGLDVTPFGGEPYVWYYEKDCLEKVFEEGSVDLGETFTKAEDVTLRDIDKLEAYLEGMYEAYGGQNAEEASRVIGLIIEKVRKLKR